MADYSELMKLEKKPATTKEVVNKSTHQQISKTTSQHTDVSANQQVNKSTHQQISKTLKRFGSYLTVESLKELKRIAFESDKKDYEVLQEAVDAYLQRTKK